MSQHGDDEATTGVVIQPGNIHSHGHDQHEVNREWDALLRRSGDEIQGDVPAGPDHSQDQAGNEGVISRLEPGKGKPAPAQLFREWTGKEGEYDGAQQANKGLTRLEPRRQVAKGDVD